MEVDKFRYLVVMYKISGFQEFHCGLTVCYDREVCTDNELITKFQESVRV